ncbi:SDR family NAD(P)-dependent oxidoreductase [Methylobacterium sp. J-077]|uniref:SDR family NAD(P)-dependent oxidoreductase n=1 Tax=Methylobacterium sp. J-077 TaxID=2836656 RepID=UPI001FB9433F|nr:SDR family oxidoreductase [Methylobacterium sp. J-077]MCJ2125160.1 SDR family oxidoreductase [Methylobacterium sp. J-077]
MSFPTDLRAAPGADGRLFGRTCIVTGASSGIGRATARLLAAEGAHVVIADVSEEALEGGDPTASVIAKEGGRSVFQRVDISDAEAVDGLVADAVREGGRLDVIVNNACIRHPRRLTELNEADWDRMMAVNLKGVFLCCRAAVRQMLTQDLRGEVRGRIVNLSSQHGMIAAPGDLAYGVGKAGVDYMTRQMAADYAADAIVCNAVAPGKIVTGQGGRLLDPAVLDRARRRTPWPRLGRPDDVARAVLFLAGEASFVTGTTLMVDGGWMAA